MLRPLQIRPAAVVVATTIHCFALASCSSKAPPSEKKEEKKADASASSSPSLNINSSPGGDPSSAAPTMAPAVQVDFNTGVGKDAIDFMGSLRASTVRADQLSNGFVKVVGLPAEFPVDKAKGFSADAAEGWLKRVGMRRGLSLPSMSKQLGDVALFRGTFINEPGGYFLRMIREGGAWKVDWLSLTSVEIKDAPEQKSASVCDDFAVAAIFGTLADKDALLKEDRALLLGAGLTPALKAKWAEPLPSDKDQGFDYNRGLLMQKAAEYGAGVDSVTIFQQGNGPAFRVEVSRAGAKAAYIVKLVKGSGPCQLLVDEIVQQ